ncbi:MAG: 2-oxoacid:ferredoxin oxidoreductase subunit beta [Dehalococcoidia bacterium]|nr:2-oxoacid:ferredoxin oxidoreductase subunit beta [Dehalococcoidia bacterium]
MTERRHIIYDYLRTTKRFPSLWCPGCGDGIFLGALLRAIDKSGYNKDQIVLVSGIGCSGRITAYADFNTLHTTHGRALTFATGIKLAKPELKVITIMGDGDAIAIGGNHFIHAARRNIEITAIVINNSVYGMTGGQLSPATPLEMKTATSPYGNLESPFDICNLAEAAGSVFVARSAVYHVTLMEKLISKALNKRGFAVLEIISQCPTQYGRRVGLSSAAEMMKWQRDNTVTVEKAKGLSEEELRGKIRVGVLVDKEALTYQEKLERLRESLKEQVGAV